MPSKSSHTDPVDERKWSHAPNSSPPSRSRYNGQHKRQRREAGRGMGEQIDRDAAIDDAEQNLPEDTACRSAPPGQQQM